MAPIGPDGITTITGYAFARVDDFGNFHYDEFTPPGQWMMPYVVITGVPASAESEVETRPLSLKVLRNPGNVPINCEYWLPREADVEIELIDAGGRVVWSDDVADEKPGRHLVQVGESRIPSGVYWVRVTADGGRAQRPVVVAK